MGSPYVAPKPLDQLAAAAARLPAHGAFSGRTSAWLHGLDLPPCDPIEVTVRLRGSVSGRAGMALRLLGKEVELVRFPGESHDLSRGGRPDRRVERLARIAGWFEKHLLGGPAVGTEARELETAGTD